jgi:hypothetical protein
VERAEQGLPRDRAPYDELLWEFPLARWLQELPGGYFTVWWNCCYGGDRIMGGALLHIGLGAPRMAPLSRMQGHTNKVDY